MQTSIHNNNAHSDSRYQTVRAVLQNAEIGAKRLADLADKNTKTARRYLERFRGETEGPPNDPDYARVVNLKQNHPEWGRKTISRALGISRERTQFHLARWLGVQSHLAWRATATAQPTQASAAPPIIDECTVEQKVQKALESMLAKFRDAGPVQPPFFHSVKSQGLLEVSLPDAHLGDQQWQPESGWSYNPDVAEKMHMESANGLLRRASCVTPERIVCIVGNDLYNIDGIQTPFQGDQMPLTETFWRGEKLMKEVIDLLLSHAPVDVIVVPGNHDKHRSFYLGRVLHAWYHHNPHVTVDWSPAPNKYYGYGDGRILLGYCHGHDVAHRDLPLRMAQEKPVQWGRSCYGAWGLGHSHSRKTMVSVTGVPLLVTHQSSHSVWIRIMPSLCPPGAWACSVGYGGHQPSSEAYFWDRIEGCTHLFIYNAPNPAS